MVVVGAASPRGPGTPTGVYIGAALPERKGVVIAHAASRTPVKLAVSVKRISLVPGEHHDSLEALLTDGTGEVVGVWIGRRSIPGLW